MFESRVLQVLPKSNRNHTHTVYSEQLTPVLLWCVWRSSTRNSQRVPVENKFTCRVIQSAWAFVSCSWRTVLCSHRSTQCSWLLEDRLLPSALHWAVDTCEIHQTPDQVIHGFCIILYYKWTHGDTWCEIQRLRFFLRLCLIKITILIQDGCQRTHLQTPQRVQSCTKLAPPS